MTQPDYRMVDSATALEACVSQCLSRSAIAVDTEFMRTDTFYPILGLIQICDGESIWLIDPLAIDDFGALENLFNAPAVTKVFHSCSEDLEVLRHQLGLLPAPVFDTQTAAAFLGYGFSRGYTAVVEQVLEVKLEQHETRSDWLQRPLSASQCHYAAEDVYYLIRVYTELLAQLKQKNRLDWMAEEMDTLMAEAREPESTERYYRRIKGAWKLPASALARLQQLAQWREDEARSRNRPRNRIVSDPVLLELARLNPAHRDNLFDVKGLHPGQIRRYGDTLMKQLHCDNPAPEVEPLPAPLDRDKRGLLAECRERINDKARELDMAAELLARKKDLETLVRTGGRGPVTLPDRLASGWRYQTIGKELYTHVAEAVV